MEYQILTSTRFGTDLSRKSAFKEHTLVLKLQLTKNWKLILIFW